MLSPGQREWYSLPFSNTGDLNESGLLDVLFFNFLLKCLNKEILLKDNSAR